MTPTLKTIEYDLSGNISQYVGMYAVIIDNFDKGALDKMFISDRDQATLMLGSASPGSCIGYHILDSHFVNSQRAWVYRLVNGALFGGVNIGNSWHSLIGTSDGTTKTYSGKVAFNRCHKGTLTIFVDDEKVGYDNSNGVIQGTYLGTSTIDYFTGDVSLTFINAPPKSAKIRSVWGFPSESWTVGKADPTIYNFIEELTQPIKTSVTKVYTDVVVPYPLEAPENAVTNQTNANFLIYDGIDIIAYADENGDITGLNSSLNTTATNTINYTNGVISFTLHDDYDGDKNFSVTYKTRLKYFGLIYGDNPGLWTDDYSCTINKVSFDKQVFGLRVVKDRTMLASETVEVKENLSRTYGLDGGGKQKFWETKINGKSYFIRVVNNFYENAENSLPSISIRHNSLAVYYDFIKLYGGTRGDAPTTAQYLAALKLFENKDDIKVDLILDTQMNPTAQLGIITLCDRDFGGRADCYGLLHVPYDIESSNNYIKDAINYRKYSLLTSTSFADLTFGHVKIFDDYSGTEIYIPSVGFLSSCMSYTADVYKPWFATAGWRRGKLPVQDVLRRLSQGERAVLNDNGINCLRYKPGKGIAFWSNMTLYGDDTSSLHIRSVRWLLIVAENAIENFLENYQFEQNDDYTRTLCRGTIEAYLSSLMTQRGLYAFSVRCDEKNNPPDLIDRLEMNVDYYLQATKPAESITARAVVTRTGVSFDTVYLDK